MREKKLNMKNKTIDISKKTEKVLQSARLHAFVAGMSLGSASVMDKLVEAWLEGYKEGLRDARGIYTKNT